MCHFSESLIGLSDYLFNCQLSVLVAITIQFAIAFATFFVENEHFVALNEGINHFAYYFSTGYGRSTYGNLAVVVDQQHFLKFNSLTAFGLGHVVDEELLAFLCLELLTVNLYDCVHYIYVYKRVLPGGGLQPQSLV